MEYNSCMKKSLENFLAIPKSQKTFFTSSINYYYHLKEGLKIQPKLTTFISIISGPNIFDIISIVTKTPKIDSIL